MILDFALLQENSPIENLSQQACLRMEKYARLLLETNQHLNLTSITDPRYVTLKHFGDSLSLSPFIPRGAKVLDLGTGGGFPGVPLLLVREDIRVVFMDARRKKLAFISDALEEIGVDGTFLHSRAEDANRQEEHRRAYDVVTARAVASLPKLCQWALPFLRRGGVFLAMKGSTVHDETADAAKILPKLGGEITGIFPVALDKEIGERFIVRVEVN